MASRMLASRKRSDNATARGKKLHDRQREGPTPQQRERGWDRRKASWAWKQNWPGHLTICRDGRYKQQRCSPRRAPEHIRARKRCDFEPVHLSRQRNIP
jgi:hypothetical protein